MQSFFSRGSWFADWESVQTKSLSCIWRTCQWLVWVSNPYSWQIVESASNHVVRWCVKTCRPCEGELELWRQEDAWRRRTGSSENVFNLVQQKVSFTYGEYCFKFAWKVIKVTLCCVAEAPTHALWDCSLNWARNIIFYSAIFERSYKFGIWNLKYRKYTGKPYKLSTRTVLGL